MWAMLESDEPTGKVIAAFPPHTPPDVLEREADGRTLILMTLENSPAYLPGTYDGERFHPVIENEDN